MREKASTLFDLEQRAETSNGTHISLRRVPKGTTVRSLEELLNGGVDGPTGGFFQMLHSTFAQLLFAMDEEIIPSSVSIGFEQKKKNA